MPEPIQTSSEAAGSGSSEAESHLAGLHRMSTTAGVTNQDYVAVNQFAVASVLLGLVGALAFLGYLMMVFPVAAMMTAVVAWRQISNSGGTQTGKGLAALGLLLGLGCGGGAIAVDVAGAMAVRGEAREIGRSINEMGVLVRHNRYHDAYELLDDSFKERFSPDVFQQNWESVQNVLGKLEQMEWNGVTPEFQSAEGVRIAYAKAKVKFSKTAEERYDVGLRQVGPRWLIFRLPGLFAEKKANKADQFTW